MVAIVHIDGNNMGQYIKKKMSDILHIAMLRKLHVLFLKKSIICLLENV